MRRRLVKDVFLRVPAQGYTMRDPVGESRRS